MKAWCFDYDCGSDSGNWEIGGLVGSNYDEVIDCYSFCFSFFLFEILLVSAFTSSRKVSIYE